ncbi:MAG: DNA polymerase III subunit delta' [Rhodobiaceae bacterium]|jgi:DNA polymerase-3 subunit delta'|nr:DNA polymerase III subunit delta' [Rhodobiaceae bacterium]
MSQADITEPLPDVDGDHPPRFTRALIGHERAQRDFLNALQGTRLPHAWLLSGPEGIGKASFAYMVARAVLSAPTPQAIQQLSPVSDTPETQLIENSVHPDLYILNRRYNAKTEKFRGDISVEDTRDMKKAFGLSASRGGWRIAIIDSIDEMNKSSVNALLKLIEEPPEKCLFLIVCHNPGRVLDTIRSRCRQLSFGALDEGLLQQIISGRLEAVDENEAAAAAFLAEGSAGRALMLAEMGGFDLYRDMVGVLEGLPQLDGEVLHGLAGRFGARSEPQSFRLFCYLFSGWLHRVVRVASTGQGFQPVFQGEAELVERLVKGDLPLEPMLSLWEKVQHQVRQVEGLNLDKKQAILEWFGHLADIIRAKSA